MCSSLFALLATKSSAAPSRPAFIAIFFEKIFALSPKLRPTHPYNCSILKAQVAELVDALVSGTSE